MKAWGGRFEKETAAILDDFHSSIHFDWQLAEEDIRGSIAHAAMLGECGIIPLADAERICEGLTTILARIQRGEVRWDPAAEDIHMNVEKLLIAEIGEVGKKLHTARSRNDQVALDIRLYLRSALDELRDLLERLAATLLDTAEREARTIMPGYTHLQRAQPVLLAHHLLAYLAMVRRDYQRLGECRQRVNASPLGAGALAGTGFSIDRRRVARELEMGGIVVNSLDAVSDRDFVAEFIFDAALIMMHLSRFCEELVMWSSAEFGFVEMDDAYSTGSSIMPQKKNPDVAELIRGKTGRVYGDLMAILTVMKGLPLAYNKDMQEDKETLFDALMTLKGCLRIFIPMLKTLTFNREKMLAATVDGFLNATDLADYLVVKGVPFREAHGIVGRLVGYCIHHGKRLEELSLVEFKEASPLIDEGVYEVLPMERVIAARNSEGGTGYAQVRQELENARKWLASLE